jgi:hypothetical protein
MRRWVVRSAMRRLLLVLALGNTGCQVDAGEYEETERVGLVEEWGPALFPSEAFVAQASPQSATIGLRLTRSGSARIEVQDLDEALEAAQELGSSANGLLAASELHEGREGERTASITLRVPSDSFDRLLDQLTELGRVLSVSVSVQDVSREYLDVDTRLRVGEETIARLRALAARGGSLEDLLAAEREIGRALTELESLRSQIRFYDQRIAESDVHISLVEPGAVLAAGAFRPVIEAFRDATETLARSVAGVIYVALFVVPWLLLATVSWLVVTPRLRARKARPSATIA